MRRALVVALLVALLPTVTAQETACSEESPCVVRIDLTDDALQATPSTLNSTGPYLIEAFNNGTANATVSLGSLSFGVAANGTARSEPFRFPSAGSYEVRAGNRTATLTVVLALPPGDADGDAGLTGSTLALAVLLPVLVGIALITIAALVIRNGAGHRHNLFFSALYFLSGLKSLSDGLKLKADDFADVSVLFPKSLFWELLGVFCALGMLPLLFLFVSSFPHPMRWMLAKPRAAVLAFIPSGLMIVVILGAILGAAPPDAFSAAVSGFNFLLFAVTVGAIVLLLRTRTTSKDPIERQQALYVLFGFLPSFVAGWAVSALQFGASNGSVDPGMADRLIANILQFISPAFELLACSLVAFAILKYNILGISPGFRLGVKSTVVGMMFIALFLTTQFIENVVLQGQVFGFTDQFTGGYGSFILSGVTGIVLFKPIEKVSNKVSDKLLPTVAGKDGMLPTEEIYHAQATYVLRDAHVTDRELAGLRMLRQQLKISDARAREIEEDVERILHVDDARLGNRATGRGDAPSSAGIGLAKREASAVAGTELHVTRGAKAPPRPASPTAPASAPEAVPRASLAPAAKPRAAAKPAAGKASAKPAGKAPAGKAGPGAGARRPGGAAKPAGKASLGSTGKAKPAGGRKGAT